jgi:hypothetical protein
VPMMAGTASTRFPPHYRSGHERAMWAESGEFYDHQSRLLSRSAGHCESHTATLKDRARELQEVM